MDIRTAWTGYSEAMAALPDVPMLKLHYTAETVRYHNHDSISQNLRTPCLSAVRGDKLLTNIPLP